MNSTDFALKNKCLFLSDIISHICKLRNNLQLSDSIKYHLLDIFASGYIFYRILINIETGIQIYATIPYLNAGISIQHIAI